jgi:pyrimidine deaminase RibD-like protein/GNAT superfamily N-acetyltransferase
MYDFVKSKGYKIQRSWDQTDAGAGFWDKHRGEERVWEQGVAEGSLTEIDRMAGSEYTGGKKSLRIGAGDKNIRKLPGTNAFMYSTEANHMEDGIIIKLWDSANTTPKPVKMRDEDDEEFAWRLKDWERNQSEDGPGFLIGKLVLEDVPTFPLKGALQVDTITVDEDYRGQGIAKSLYGVALSILRRPLVAGRGQTPGGRRNWLSLASTPGVEVKGYLGLNEDRLKNADSDIDTIMGKLGGQYIGQSRPPGIRYFAFDVVAGSGELAPAVKTSLSQIYGHTMGNLGLYATWSGVVNENFADGRNPDLYEIHNYKKLDGILTNLCDLVVQGQKTDPEKYGMVAAAVLDNNNRLVTGVNLPAKDGTRRHAERVAIDRYHAQYGEIPPGSIVITTCSPCSEHMDERYGEDCTQLIADAGVNKVYCGFRDPTQHEQHRTFNLIETADQQIRSLCEQFAQQFMHTEDQQQTNENFADGRHPEDKGDSQRHGIPKGATMAELEKASHAAGRKGQLARWQLNMRRGKKK